MSQAAYRAAAATFLQDYAGYAGVTLQMYPARPRTLSPPTGFVDRITETYTSFTEITFQRNPSVTVIVIFGTFDSKDVANQKDDFVDGFLDWVYARGHQSGPNSLIWVSESEDLPDYVHDWLPSEKQRSYFAVRFTLEGFDSN
jgi:hypothetical protein